MLKFQKLVMNIVTAPPTEIAHSTELLKRKKKLAITECYIGCYRTNVKTEASLKDTAII